jgi:hypothetical protein
MCAIYSRTGEGREEMAEDRFDGMFLAIAQQAQGIEPLLDNLFSFLRRKTDFYSGASSDQVETLVLKVLRKHTALADQTERDKKKEREKEEKKRKERIAKQKQVSVVIWSVIWSLSARGGRN